MNGQDNTSVKICLSAGIFELWVRGNRKQFLNPIERDDDNCVILADLDALPTEMQKTRLGSSGVVVTLLDI